MHFIALFPLNERSCLRNTKYILPIVISTYIKLIIFCHFDKLPKCNVIMYTGIWDFSIYRLSI